MSTWNLLQDFTTSVSRLKKALNEVKINAGTGACANLPGLGGGPSHVLPLGPVAPCSMTPCMWLRMTLSVRKWAQGNDLLTDGEDQGSR